MFIIWNLDCYGRTQLNLIEMDVYSVGHYGLQCSAKHKKLAMNFEAGMYDGAEFRREEKQIKEEDTDILG